MTNKDILLYKVVISEDSKKSNPGKNSQEKPTRKLEPTESLKEGNQ